MHNYSINTNERRTVLFLLAAISILASKGLQSIPLLQHEWITVPGSFAVYGLLCWVFNKWLWIPFAKLKWVSTPYLAGKWTGEIKSSYNPDIPTKAELEISQTWMRICFKLKFEHSDSFSKGVSIMIEEDGSFEVTYQYLNKPRVASSTTMNMHEGTTSLIGSQDRKSFTGYYFTGRDRGNYGDLSFKRIDKNS